MHDRVTGVEIEDGIDVGVKGAKSALVNLADIGREGEFQVVWWDGEVEGFELDDDVEAI